MGVLDDFLNDEDTGVKNAPKIDDSTVQLVKKLDEKLEKIAGKVIERLNKQDEEVKKKGGSSTQTAQEIEAWGVKWTEVNQSLADLKKDLDEKFKEDGRQIDVFNPSGHKMVSLGEFVTDQKIQDQIFREKQNTTRRLELKSFLGGKTKGLKGAMVFVSEDGKEITPEEMKANPSDALRHVTASRFFNDGALRINPLSNFTTLEVLREPLRIEQLIRVLPTRNDAVQYAEATVFDNLRAVLDTAAAAADTTLVLSNSTGFFVNQPIFVKTNTVMLSTRVTAVDHATNTITVAQALPDAAARNSPVVSQVFAGTPEGNLKPLMGLRQPKLKTAPIITLAHAIMVPRQVLADLPRLRAEIDDNLISGLDTNREFHLLYGDGSDTMLPGVLNHPGRQIYRQDSVNYGDVANPRYQTRLDTLRRAATLTYAAYLPANTVMMNPFDWQEIELMKDNENRYLWIGSVAEGGTPRLWQLPITIAQTLVPGSALMADWSKACTLHNREDANIRMTDSHEGQFLENMITILAEERLGFTVERPQAFVEVVFTEAY